ncbi:MAG: epoxyqueuosine reductase QueH [Lachnospiraceae bacterium]
MNRNYQKDLENLILKNQAEGVIPKLLLHSCCAPCSTYVIEYLSDFFEITVFYYNPNIYPDQEYEMRAREQKEFIRKFESKYPVTFLEGKFDKEIFYQNVKGHESDPEGSERCLICYRQRLEKTAEQATEHKMDYFATTLTISPLKNTQALNEIGSQLSEEFHVKYLASDFKKQNGYKRSIELSKEYNMYRQDYCGCIFSMKERLENRNNKE